MPITLLSRRSLLAATAMRASLAQTAPGVFRLPKEVRLAVIGLEGHLNEVLGRLPQVPDVKLVAISDPQSDVVAKVAKEPHAAGARQYNDYRKLLDHEQLDLVAVYGSNADRAGAIVAAAERGLHIVAEKPLVIEREELERVRKAVQKNGVHMTMLLTLRESGPYLAIKQIVDAGEIGEVVQISTQKSHKLGYRPPWMQKRATFGGSIPYIGIHMVDFMRWASGRELVEAASFQSHLAFPEYGEMENNMCTIFRMDNDGTAVLRMDYLRPETAPSAGDDRVRLAGTRGVVEYHATAGAITLITSTEKLQTKTTFPKGRPLFIDFLDSIYHSTAQSLTLEDIYRASEIVIGAREAAEGHRLVKL